MNPFETVGNAWDRLQDWGEEKIDDYREAREAEAARQAAEEDAVRAVAAVAHGRETDARFEFRALQDDFSINNTGRFQPTSTENKNPNNYTRDELYARLAEQFDERKEGLEMPDLDDVPTSLKGAVGAFNEVLDRTGNAFRQGPFGDWGSDREVQEREDIIDRVVAQVNARSFSENELDIVPGHVDANLVRSIMFVEQRYMPSFMGIDVGETLGPMNVNFEVWKDVLEPHGITSASMLRDDEVGIRAGVLILSHLDATIPPEITGVDRIALVASMYGNTLETIEAGRPIMYGGKVAQVMEERYPSVALVRQEEMEQATQLAEATVEKASEVMDVASNMLEDLVERFDLGDMFKNAGVEADRGELVAQNASTGRDVAIG